MSAQRSSDPLPEDHGETPTTEVRVYRDGRLLERELFESEVEAALAIEAWTEIEGVECEVDDLSLRHRPGEVVHDPEPAGLPIDEHPPA